MSFSPCLKGRVISSPLEAGRHSVADGHHLPNHVNEALEYASKRLGRKAAHITLLVVRRDHQLPTSPIASPTSAVGSLPVSATSTPSRSTFPTSRIEALKQLLIRPSHTGEGQIRERIVHVHLDHLRNGTVSPAFSEASAISASTVSSASTADSTFSHRMRWPGSPSTYGSVPVTPATPFTVMSSLSGADGNSSVSRFGTQNSAQFGMKLVYAHPLSPREEKVLTQALEKAAKKFKLEPSWLPQAVSPSTLGLPVDLVLKSTAQKETLFSSEHLTLLSLDHLYTFRTALQAYARTRAPGRLEDAVDELRRLFLANCRRALRKSALLAAYRWLDPLHDAALADVCRMYERAYGGIERESGVENDVDPVPAWPLAESDQDSGDMEQSLAGRVAMPSPLHRDVEASTSPQHRPVPRAETPVLDLTDALDKEMLLCNAEIDLDDQSELDAIEAWYREIQTQNDMPTVPIHPLRSHPAAAPAVVEILPPPPSPPPPPPPPPTSSPSQRRPWPQPSETAELSEMRRTTPKLRPAPQGRCLALKLQTTFDKPVVASKQRSTSKPLKPQPLTAKAGADQEQNQEPKQEEVVEEEEEEELTARPHSAIKSFANARWTAAADSNNINGGGGSISIDEMLMHGGSARPAPPLPHHGDSDEYRGRGGQPLQSPVVDERVGPMTPNGYDDISPITRGEWGFLMFGKGRTAGVEMC
ncbi:hypothetical protein C8A00DRAFT_11254 [Chaetomidium leptoderma]|uniref:DUF7582 domain-containing protein n=1 Tax=Chaetomidium leptoderma TaxID=669021 RepID=A0AAN6VUB9_9PEZI|nr:hypothetical protein C8A00DRAFT_11254 [Chaetomidium leptoderma]